MKRDGSARGAPGVPCKLPLERLSSLLPRLAPPVRLLCLFCERSFASAPLLHKHTQRGHLLPVNRRASSRHASAPDGFHPGCNLCGRHGGVQTASDLPALFHHLIDKHPVKYFACRSCQIRFSTEKALISHDRDVHSVSRENVELVHRVKVNFLRKDDSSSSENKCLQNEISPKGSDVSDQLTCEVVRYGVDVKVNQSTKNVTLNIPIENSGTLVKDDISKKSVKGKSIRKTKIQSQKNVGKSLNELSNPQDVRQQMDNTPFPNGFEDFEDNIVANLIVTPGVSEPNQMGRQVGNQRQMLTDNVRKGILKGNEPSVSLSRIQFKPDSNDAQMLSRLGLTQNRSPRAQSLRRCRKTPVTESRASSEMSRKDKLKSKNDSNDFIINKSKNDPSTKFDPDFYSSVSGNVRENLLKHLDGKLGKANVACDVPDIIDPKIKSTHAVVLSPREQPAEIHGSDVRLNAITVFPTLLTSDQYGSDKIPHYSYGAKVQTFKKIITKNSWKWKWDPIKKYKYCNEDGKIVRKIRPLLHTSPRDLSKLDIWTQLSMREKYDIHIENKSTENSDPDKRRTERQKQINELNTILDSRVFPEIEKECIAAAGNSQEDAEQPMAEESTVVGDNNPLLASLGLVPRAEGSSGRPGPVLTGEWARPRCYVCCVCGRRAPCIRLLEAHQASQHPYVHATHYELVGQELLQTQLYKHLYIPGIRRGPHCVEKSKLRKQSIARQIKNIPRKILNLNQSTRILRTTTRNIKSLERECTKCKKLLLPTELYRHILECAGDYGWIMAKKKCKYKPFGARRRKLKGLYKRERPQEEGEKSEIKERTTRPKLPSRPRTKPSDAETIQRMLANLPAKRASRQILNLPSPKIRPFLNEKNKQGHIVRHLVSSKSRIQRNKMMCTSSVITISEGIGKKLRRVTRSVANKIQTLQQRNYLRKRKNENSGKSIDGLIKSQLREKSNPCTIEANSSISTRPSNKSQISKKRLSIVPASKCNNSAPSKDKKEDSPKPSEERKSKNRTRVPKNYVASVVTENTNSDHIQNKKHRLQRILRRRPVISSKIVDNTKPLNKKRDLCEAATLQNKTVDQLDKIKDQENADVSIETASLGTNILIEKEFIAHVNVASASTSVNPKVKKTCKKTLGLKLKWKSKGKTNARSLENNPNECASVINKSPINDVIEDVVSDNHNLVIGGQHNLDVPKIVEENPKMNCGDTKTLCDTIDDASGHFQSVSPDTNTENENTSNDMTKDEVPLPKKESDSPKVEETDKSASSIVVASRTNWSSMGFPQPENTSDNVENKNVSRSKSDFSSSTGQTTSIVNKVITKHYSHGTTFSVPGSLQIFNKANSKITIEPVRTLNNAEEFEIDNIDKPPLFSFMNSLNLKSQMQQINQSTTSEKINNSSVLTNAEKTIDVKSNCPADSDASLKHPSKFKSSKSRRGLNDCIAMLKGKLTEKIITPLTPTPLPNFNTELESDKKSYDECLEPLDLSGRVPKPEDLSLKSTGSLNMEIRSMSSAKNNLTVIPIRKPVYDPTLRIPQYPLNLGSTTLNNSSNVSSKPNSCTESEKKKEDNYNYFLPVSERKSINTSNVTVTSKSLPHKGVNLPKLTQLSLLPQTLANTIEKLSLHHREEIVKKLPLALAHAVENLNFIQTDTNVSSNHWKDTNDFIKLKNSNHCESELRDINLSTVTSVNKCNQNKNSLIPQTSEISTQTVVSRKSAKILQSTAEFSNINTDLFLIDPNTGIIIERNKIEQLLNTSLPQQDSTSQIIDITDSGPIKIQSSENTDLFLIDPCTGIIERNKIEEPVQSTCSPQKDSNSQSVDIIDSVPTKLLSPEKLMNDEIIDLTNEIHDSYDVANIDNDIPSLSESELQLKENSQNVADHSENNSQKDSLDPLKTSPEKGTLSLRSIRIKTTTEKLRLRSFDSPQIDETKSKNLLVAQTDLSSNLSNAVSKDNVQSNVINIPTENTISSSKDLNVISGCQVNVPLVCGEPAIQQDEVSSTQHSTVEDGSDFSPADDVINKDSNKNVSEKLVNSCNSQPNDKVIVDNSINVNLDIKSERSGRTLRKSQSNLDAIKDPEIFQSLHSSDGNSNEGKIRRKVSLKKRKVSKDISNLESEKEKLHILEKTEPNDTSLNTENIDKLDGKFTVTGKETNELDGKQENTFEQQNKTSFNKLLMKENNILSETALTPSNVLEFHPESSEKCELNKSHENKEETIVRRSSRKSKSKSLAKECEKTPEKKSNNLPNAENCNDIDLNPDISGAAIIPGESCQANLGESEVSIKQNNDSSSQEIPLQQNDSDDEDDICLAVVAKKKFNTFTESQKFDDKIVDVQIEHTIERVCNDVENDSDKLVKDKKIVNQETIKISDKKKLKKTTESKRNKIKSKTINKLQTRVTRSRLLKTVIDKVNKSHIIDDDNLPLSFEKKAISESLIEKNIIPLKKRKIKSFIDMDTAPTSDKLEKGNESDVNLPIKSGKSTPDCVNIDKIASVNSVKLNENGHLIFKMHKKITKNRNDFIKSRDFVNTTLVVDEISKNNKSHRKLKNKHKLLDGTKLQISTEENITVESVICQTPKETKAESLICLDTQTVTTIKQACDKEISKQQINVMDENTPKDTGAIKVSDVTTTEKVAGEIISDLPESLNISKISPVSTKIKKNIKKRNRNLKLPAGVTGEKNQTQQLETKPEGFPLEGLSCSSLPKNIVDESSNAEIFLSAVVSRDCALISTEDMKANTETKSNNRAKGIMKKKSKIRKKHIKSIAVTGQSTNQQSDTCGSQESVIDEVNTLNCVNILQKEENNVSCTNLKTCIVSVNELLPSHENPYSFESCEKVIAPCEYTYNSLKERGKISELTNTTKPNKISNNKKSNRKSPRDLRKNSDVDSSSATSNTQSPGNEESNTKSKENNYEHDKETINTNQDENVNTSIIKIKHQIPCKNSFSQPISSLNEKYTTSNHHSVVESDVVTVSENHLINTFNEKSSNNKLMVRTSSPERIDNINLNAIGEDLTNKQSVTEEGRENDNMLTKKKGRFLAQYNMLKKDVPVEQNKKLLGSEMPDIIKGEIKKKLSKKQLTSSINDNFPNRLKGINLHGEGELVESPVKENVHLQTLVKESYDFKDSDDVFEDSDLDNLSKIASSNKKLLVKKNIQTKISLENSFVNSRDRKKPLISNDFSQVEGVKRDKTMKKKFEIDENSSQKEISKKHIKFKRNISIVHSPIDSTEDNLISKKNLKSRLLPVSDEKSKENQTDASPLSSNLSSEPFSSTILAEKQSAKGKIDHLIKNVKPVVTVRPQRISQRRRTLATCEFIGNEMNPQSSDDESTIQDKFLADFGMFTEKRPRKSTLLAIKKISQTFKPDTSDTDDLEQNSNSRFLRRSGRSQKKRTRKASMNQDNIADVCAPKGNDSDGCKTEDSAAKPESTNQQPNKPFSQYTDDGLSTDDASGFVKEYSHGNKFENYCSICKRKFRRPDNLIKHKMTLMHISKLSEMEAKINKVTDNEQTIVLADECTACVPISDQPELVDNKAKMSDNSNRAYKNLAERKSFENENHSISLETINKQLKDQIVEECKVDKVHLRDQIVQKYAIGKIQLKDQIVQENVVSKTQLKDQIVQENVVNKIQLKDQIVQENLEPSKDDLHQPLPEISVDSSRKTLSCDEALFFECCSLLKESKSARKEVKIVDPFKSSEKYVGKSYPNNNEDNDIISSTEANNSYNLSVKTKITEQSPKTSQNNFDLDVVTHNNVLDNVNAENNSYACIDPDRSPGNLKKLNTNNLEPAAETVLLASENVIQNELSNNCPFDIPSDDKTSDQKNESSNNKIEELDEKLCNTDFDPYSAETLMVRSNSDDFSDNGDSMISCQDTELQAAQSLTKTQIPNDCKISDQMNLLNEFEDKFDKIKRKAREKAQAAQEAMAAVLSPRLQSRKGTKKNRSKSRKSAKSSDDQQCKMAKTVSKFSNFNKKRTHGTLGQKNNSKKVLTKGALKGFDGVRVSISTDEINLHSILDNSKSIPQEHTNLGKDKPPSKDLFDDKINSNRSEIDKCVIDSDDTANSTNRSKKIKQKRNKYHLPESSRNKMDSAASIKLISSEKQQLDIYEFFDDEDDDDVSDKFKFRTPANLNSKDRGISVKKHDNESRPSESSPSKNILETQNEDSQISSLSFSDRDDFTYMSDDYTANDSEDETNHSLGSIDTLVNTNKNNKKHKKSSKNPTNLKKSAIMGKIFKNNAIRNDQKNSNHDVMDTLHHAVLTVGQTDMDQLFDSLLEQTIATNNDNMLRDTKSPCNITDTEELYSAGDDARAVDTNKKEDSNARSPSIGDYFSDNDESNEKAIRPYPRVGQRKIVPRLKARSSDDEISRNSSPVKNLSTKMVLKKSDIGVASHKSQRKCTTGKQNVLVESWSSESDYEDFRQFEEYSSIPRSQRHHRRPRRSGRNRPSEDGKLSTSDVNTKSDSCERISSNDKRTKNRYLPENGKKHINFQDSLEANSDSVRNLSPYDENHKSSERHGVSGRRVSFNTSNSLSKGRCSRRKRRQSQKPFDYDDEFKPARIAEPLATQRRNKRAASEMLYYWSSSSDDDVQNASVDTNSRDPEPIEQHGWIVGDSHKKLVTMLAHAKGRKIDDNASVKEKRSRPST